MRIIILDSHRPVHHSYNPASGEDDKDIFVVLADDDPLPKAEIPEFLPKPPIDGEIFNPARTTAPPSGCCPMTLLHRCCSSSDVVTSVVSMLFACCLHVI